MSSIGHYIVMYPIVALSRISNNSKTGPIPVSTTEASTCPDVCPLKAKGCFAKGGPLRMHWEKVPERGMPWEAFCKEVQKLPAGTLWRHNQAGDLPGENNILDAAALRMLVRANRGKRGFTYTHKPMTMKNREALAEANLHGFTVNVSLNSVEELDAFGVGALPVAVILPALAKGEREPRAFRTAGGNRVVVCPAQYRETTCLECGLCQRADRNYAIGFRPHGYAHHYVSREVSGKKRVSLAVV